MDSDLHVRTSMIRAPGDVALVLFWFCSFIVSALDELQKDEKVESSTPESKEAPKSKVPETSPETAVTKTLVKVPPNATAEVLKSIPCETSTTRNYPANIFDDFEKQESKLMESAPNDVSISEGRRHCTDAEPTLPVAPLSPTKKQADKKQLKSDKDGKTLLQESRMTTEALEAEPGIAKSSKVPSEEHDTKQSKHAPGSGPETSEKEEHDTKQSKHAPGTGRETSEKAAVKGSLSPMKAHPVKAYPENAVVLKKRGEKSRQDESTAADSMPATSAPATKPSGSTVVPVTIEEERAAPLPIISLAPRPPSPDDTSATVETLCVTEVNYGDAGVSSVTESTTVAYATPKSKMAESKSKPSRRKDSVSSSAKEKCEHLEAISAQHQAVTESTAPSDRQARDCTQLTPAAEEPARITAIQKTKDSPQTVTNLKSNDANQVSSRTSQIPVSTTRKAVGLKASSMERKSTEPKTNAADGKEAKHSAKNVEATEMLTHCVTKLVLTDGDEHQPRASVQSHTSEEQQCLLKEATAVEPSSNCESMTATTPQVSQVRELLETPISTIEVLEATAYESEVKTKPKWHITEPERVVTISAEDFVITSTAKSAAVDDCNVRHATEAVAENAVSAENKMPESMSTLASRKAQIKAQEIGTSPSEESARGESASSGYHSLKALTASSNEMESTSRPKEEMKSDALKSLDSIENTTSVKPLATRDVSKGEQLQGIEPFTATHKDANAALTDTKHVLHRCTGQPQQTARCQAATRRMAHAIGLFANKESRTTTRRPTSGVSFVFREHPKDVTEESPEGNTADTTRPLVVAKSGSGVAAITEELPHQRESQAKNQAFRLFPQATRQARDKDVSHGVPKHSLQSLSCAPTDECQAKESHKSSAAFESKMMTAYQQRQTYDKTKISEAAKAADQHIDAAALNEMAVIQEYSAPTALTVRNLSAERYQQGEAVKPHLAGLKQLTQSLIPRPLHKAENMDGASRILVHMAEPLEPAKHVVSMQIIPKSVAVHNIQTMHCSEVTTTAQKQMSAELIATAPKPLTAVHIDLIEDIGPHKCAFKTLDDPTDQRLHTKQVVTIPDTQPLCCQQVRLPPIAEASEVQSIVTVAFSEPSEAPTKKLEDPRHQAERLPEEFSFTSLELIPYPSTSTISRVIQDEEERAAKMAQWVNSGQDSLAKRGYEVSVFNTGTALETAPEQSRISDPNASSHEPSNWRAGSMESLSASSLDNLMRTFYSFPSASKTDVLDPDQSQAASPSSRLAVDHSFHSFVPSVTLADQATSQAFMQQEPKSVDMFLAEQGILGSAVPPIGKETTKDRNSDVPRHDTKGYMPSATKRFDYSKPHAIYLKSFPTTGVSYKDLETGSPHTAPISAREKVISYLAHAHEAATHPDAETVTADGMTTPTTAVSPIRDDAVTVQHIQEPPQAYEPQQAVTKLVERFETFRVQKLDSVVPSHARTATVSNRSHEETKQQTVSLDQPEQRHSVLKREPTSYFVKLIAEPPSQARRQESSKLEHVEIIEESQTKIPAEVKSVADDAKGIPITKPPKLASAPLEKNVFEPTPLLGPKPIIVNEERKAKKKSDPKKAVSIASSHATSDSLQATPDEISCTEAEPDASPVNSFSEKRVPDLDKIPTPPVTPKTLDHASLTQLVTAALLDQSPAEDGKKPEASVEPEKGSMPQIDVSPKADSQQGIKPEDEACDKKEDSKEVPGVIDRKPLDGALVLPELPPPKFVAEFSNDEVSLRTWLYNGQSKACHARSKVGKVASDISPNRSSEIHTGTSNKPEDSSHTGAEPSFGTYQASEGPSSAHTLASGTPSADKNAGADDMDETPGPMELSMGLPIRATTSKALSPDRSSNSQNINKSGSPLSSTNTPAGASSSFQSEFNTIPTNTCSYVNPVDATNHDAIRAGSDISTVGYKTCATEPRPRFGDTNQMSDNTTLAVNAPISTSIRTEAEPAPETYQHTPSWLQQQEPRTSNSSLDNFFLTQRLNRIAGRGPDGIQYALRWFESRLNYLLETVDAADSHQIQTGEHDAGRRPAGTTNLSCVSPRGLTDEFQIITDSPKKDTVFPLQHSESNMSVTDKDRSCMCNFGKSAFSPRHVNNTGMQSSRSKDYCHMEIADENGNDNPRENTLFSDAYPASTATGKESSNDQRSYIITLSNAEQSSLAATSAPPIGSPVAKSISIQLSWNDSLDASVTDKPNKILQLNQVNRLVKDSAPAEPHQARIATIPNQCPLKAIQLGADDYGRRATILHISQPVPKKAEMIEFAPTDREDPFTSFPLVMDEIVEDPTQWNIDPVADEDVGPEVAAGRMSLPEKVVQRKLNEIVPPNPVQQAERIELPDLNPAHCCHPEESADSVSSASQKRELGGGDQSLDSEKLPTPQFDNANRHNEVNTRSQVPIRETSDGELEEAGRTDSPHKMFNFFDGRFNGCCDLLSKGDASVADTSSSSAAECTASDVASNAHTETSGFDGYARSNESRFSAFTTLQRIGKAFQKPGCNQMQSRSCVAVCTDCAGTLESAPGMHGFQFDSFATSSSGTPDEAPQLSFSATRSSNLNDAPCGANTPEEEECKSKPSALDTSTNIKTGCKAKFNEQQRNEPENSTLAIVSRTKPSSEGLQLNPKLSMEQYGSRRLKWWPQYIPPTISLAKALGTVMADCRSTSRKLPSYFGDTTGVSNFMEDSENLQNLQPLSLVSKSVAATSCTASTMITFKDKQNAGVEGPTKETITTDGRLKNSGPIRHQRRHQKLPKVKCVQISFTQSPSDRYGAVCKPIARVTMIQKTIVTLTLEKERIVCQEKPDLDGGATHQAAKQTYEHCREMTYVTESQYWNRSRVDGPRPFVRSRARSTEV